MNFDDIISKPAFARLTEEQKNAYRFLYENLRGKNAMEAMMVIAEFNKRMPKGNPPTDAEQEMMIQAATEGMPEKDRENFMRVVRLVRTVM